MNYMDTYIVERLTQDRHNDMLRETTRNRLAYDATQAQSNPHSTISPSDRVGRVIAALVQIVSTPAVRCTRELQSHL